MWKRLNSNQMCEQFSYKEVSYREVLLYIEWNLLQLRISIIYEHSFFPHY